MSLPAEDDDRELRLDEAAAKYLELQASGQPIDREQWLAQYSDLADELAAFLSDFDQLKPVVTGAKSRMFPAQQDVGKGAFGSRHPLTRLGLMAGPAGENGTALPRYRLRQFLARGGMGEVWLADDAHVGRPIAVKRIRSERRASPTMEERFLLESQIMGQLEHPCIVPLHDLGRDEAGELFSVMKWVKGCSLKERLGSFHATKSAHDWPRQVEFLRLLEAFVNICHAVAYAHSRGVLHRDIKPDNIMLGNFGEALLLDWGLAKTLDLPEKEGSLPLSSELIHSSASGAAATQAGAIMGSPAYMPPEMATGRSDAADPRTDIYLLGATLYEILTGRPPRAGNSPLELIDLAQHTPPPPPRLTDRRIPATLEAICLRAMAHRSEQRYPSATALAEDIENFVAGEPVSAYREPPVVRAWRWCRRHRRAIQRATVGLGLAMLSVVGVLIYQHARVLEDREVARQQLVQFHRLADEAAFFAASTDSVREHAPYFDPQRAIDLGDAALKLAGHWGDQGAQMPLVEERSTLTSELYNLLLLLADLRQRSAATAESQTAALTLLNRAATLRPASRAYHQLRARCLRQLSKADEADREAAIAEHQRTPLTAQDYFMDGEHLRSDATRSDRPTAPRLRADAHAEALLGAVAAYQQAVRLDPRHYWAHFQLARCYLRMQRGPEAVAALGTCVALRPTSPWAYSTRGLAYGLLGRFAEAESDFDQVARLAPDFRPARLNRGFVYFLQNMDTAALAELDAVLQPPADRILVEAAFYRAQINYQRGDFSAAQHDCLLLLGQRPGFAPAHSLLARVHFRRGDDANGMESVDALLACSHQSTFPSQSREARSARGRALCEVAVALDLVARQRVLQLALLEFEGAGGHEVEADVTTVKDLLQLAGEVVQQYTGRLAEAPRDSATRKKRAWNYVKLQRYDLAADDFETAIEQSPEDAEAHSGLGYVLALRGERAASELEAARAVLCGAHGYLVLHNVACIYAELANASDQQQPHYEDLALTMLERAVRLARQNTSGVDERELIRSEPAFHESLRSRPEFRQLLGPVTER